MTIRTLPDAILRFEADTGLNGAGGSDLSFSLEDLIPDELKEAREKKVKDTGEDVPAGRQELLQQEEAEDGDAEEIPIPQQNGESDEDFDYSPEAIDKLLKGDVTAIEKKHKQPEEEKEVPPWHDNPKYKELATKAKQYGFSQQELDEIIENVSDAKVIANSTLVEGLREKAEEYEKAQRLTKSEIARLRKVESAAHFDSLDSTQKEFFTPMRELSGKIRNILDLEGSPVSVQDVLQAKDRTTLIEIMKSSDLSDEDMTNLGNYWRGYRELSQKYNETRGEAQRDLKKFLGGRLEDEDIKERLRDTLGDFVKSDPMYNYIKEGIMNPSEMPQNVSNVLATALANFKGIVKGLSPDLAHDSKYISDLGKYVLQSAHTYHLQAEHAEVLDERDTLKNQVRDLTRAYYQLAKSGKGIIGKGGSSNFLSNGNTKGSDSDKKEKLKKMTAFMEDGKLENLFD